MYAGKVMGIKRMRKNANAGFFIFPGQWGKGRC